LHEFVKLCSGFGSDGADRIDLILLLETHYGFLSERAKIASNIPFGIERTIFCQEELKLTDFLVRIPRERVLMNKAAGGLLVVLTA